MTYEVRIKNKTAELLFQELGFYIKPKTYDTEWEGEKTGIIGSVFARLGLPNENIGLAVHLALEHGVNVTEVHYRRNKPESHKLEPKPQNLLFSSILEQALYDETFHLKPDGKIRH